MTRSVFFRGGHMKKYQLFLPQSRRLMSRAKSRDESVLQWNLAMLRKHWSSGSTHELSGMRQKKLIFFHMPPSNLHTEQAVKSLSPIFHLSKKEPQRKIYLRLKEITSIHRQTLPLNQISPIRIRIWAWKESLKKCTQSDIATSPHTLVAATWHQTNATNYTKPISQFFSTLKSLPLLAFFCFNFK